MRTSDVLNKAADHLQERGWYQFDGNPNGDPGTGTCVLGALGAVVQMKLDLPEHVSAVDALRNYLGLPSGAAVFRWNDLPTTHKPDVIAALRCTALIELARETSDRLEAVAV